MGESFLSAQQMLLPVRPHLQQYIYICKEMDYDGEVQ